MPSEPGFSKSYMIFLSIPMNIVTFPWEEDMWDCDSLHIVWPLAGKNRRGRGRCVYGVWTETAKDEEIICKEKSVILCNIIFIIISLFCLYEVILLSEIPQSSSTNYFFVA